MKDNNLLKEVCGEMAEIALATRYGVSQEKLFDEDGSFYPQYQDAFNTLYDYAEERMAPLFNDEIHTLLNTSLIYTTGAFLAPLNVTDGNGNVVWLWAVSQFEDDTYLDGKICSPVVRADTEKDLFNADNEECSENICCAGFPDCFCNEQ